MKKKITSLFMLLVFNNIFLFNPAYCENHKTMEINTNTVTVNKDEEIIIALMNSISTESLNPNEDVLAFVAMDLFVGGDIAIPNGSLVYGKHIGSSQAKPFFRNGKIKINFYELHTPDGQIIPIQTKDIKHLSFFNNIKKVLLECLIGETVALPFCLLLASLECLDNIISKNSSKEALTLAKDCILYVGINVELPDNQGIVLKIKKPFEIIPEEN